MKYLRKVLASTNTLEPAMLESLCNWLTGSYNDQDAKALYTYTLPG